MKKINILLKVVKIDCVKKAALRLMLVNRTFFYSKKRNTQLVINITEAFLRVFNLKCNYGLATMKRDILFVVGN